MMRGCKMYAGNLSPGCRFSYEGTRYLIHDKAGFDFSTDVEDAVRLLVHNESTSEIEEIDIPEWAIVGYLGVVW